MKSDAIAFGVAGILFGLIAGWVIGSQQSARRVLSAPAPSAQTTTAQQPSSGPALLDEAKVKAFKSVAEREPTNAKPRVELGNLYFDAERYDEAIKWYSEAVKLDPRDPNVSTDLGVSFYYSNQPDRALELFDQSLKVDPRHLKTILNVGVVKAFGKQDLEGAEKAWQQVISLAPNSPEGQAAKRALDSLRAAHPSGASSSRPGA